MFQAFEERRGFFRLFLSERGRLSAAFSDEIAARVGQHTRRLREQLVELMRQGIEEGALRGGRPGAARVGVPGHGAHAASSKRWRRARRGRPDAGRTCWRCSWTARRAAAPRARRRSVKSSDAGAGGCWRRWPPLAAACGSRREIRRRRQPAPAPVEMTARPPSSRRVDRMLRVTGTLIGGEEAEVAAEIAGPRDRRRRSSGAAAWRRARRSSRWRRSRRRPRATDAEANVAQLEARLALRARRALRRRAGAGSGDGQGLARPGRSGVRPDQEPARSEGRVAGRVRPAAQAGRRRRATSTARRATRRSSSTGCSRARRRALSLARKALGDTVVRAPFAGLVVERKVSVGDFVTRGTKVVTVVKVVAAARRTDGARAVGRSRSRRASRSASRSTRIPGRYFDGQVRFVSPAFRADQRALTVEAIVPNADDALKPGHVRVGGSDAAGGGAVAGRAVPAPSRRWRASATSSSSAATSVEAADDHAGRDASARVTEVVEGLAAGDDGRRQRRVASLTDGARVRVGGRRPRTAAGPAGEAVGAFHAVACRSVRPAAGVRVGADPDARPSSGRSATASSASIGFPKVDFPTIMITTRQPGAAPRADRDRDHRQDRRGRQHDQRPRRAALDVGRGRVDRDGVVPAREGRRRRGAGGARPGQPRPAAAAADDPAAGHREDGPRRGAGAGHRGVGAAADPRRHRVRGQGAAAPARDA